MAIKMSTTAKINKIMDDFELFCLNFVKIVDSDGEMIPFKLNECQQEFINNKGKFNIILKPRQLGFTTVSLAYCLWNALKYPNTNYLIVSYKGDSAKDLFRKLKKMNNLLPRDKYSNVFYETIRDNRDELVLSNGSTITSTTAGGNQDIGRGQTYMYILLSESAFYDDLEGILLSIEPTLMKNERSTIVLESTANGFNHFRDLYYRAKDGHSKYKSFFFPFYSKAFELMYEYEINEAVEWFKQRNRGARLKANDLIEKEEVRLHKAGSSLKMIMWRYYQLQDKPLSKFQQEYPSTDIEAFISTSKGVYDLSMITDAYNNAIPAIPVPDLMNVVPEQLKQWLNKGLEIYHLPKHGIKYYMGVDVASGSGGDYSTCCVLDQDGVQVASFHNNTVPTYKFAEIVRQIGWYFGYAFIVVERNGFGTTILDKLRKDCPSEHVYLNLYKMKQFDQGKQRLKLGWLNTNVTKNLAVSNSKEQFECGLVQLNSKELLKQMQIFVDKNGKTGNVKGSQRHDDLVIAYMLSIVAMKANKYYVDVKGV